MIYLASPYSHKDPIIVKSRHMVVEETVALLINEGFKVYSPIVHCHPMAIKFTMRGDWEFWAAYNRDMIRRMDQVWFLDIVGLAESTGCKAEYEFAKLCEIPCSIVTRDGQLIGEMDSWPA